MIITNHHNIPEALVNVIVGGIQKPKPDVMRVTELISPPLMKQLALKHWDEITIDVSDYLFSILGQSVHYILEKGTPSNAIGEERVSVDTEWGKLSGKSDLYFESGIEDWKVTSVFSFLLGVKDEWVAQLNVYKYLWEKNHFPVKFLTINAILRDWMRTKARFDVNYPQIPFMKLKADLWGERETEEYIKERFVAHGLKDVECTPYEKWERPTVFAVIRGKNKRATRVLNSVLEAELYIDGVKDEKVKKEMKVVERIGERVRCTDYCLVRDFCPYNKKKGE